MTSQLPELSPIDAGLFEHATRGDHAAMVAALGSKPAVIFWLLRPDIAAYLEAWDGLCARSLRIHNDALRHHLLDALETSLKTASSNAERLHAAVLTLRACRTPLDTPLTNAPAGGHSGRTSGGISGGMATALRGDAPADIAFPLRASTGACAVAVATASPNSAPAPTPGASQASGRGGMPTALRGEAPKHSAPPSASAADTSPTVAFPTTHIDPSTPFPLGKMGAPARDAPQPQDSRAVRLIAAAGLAPLPRARDRP